VASRPDIAPRIATSNRCSDVTRTEMSDVGPRRPVVTVLQFTTAAARVPCQRVRRLGRIRVIIERTAIVGINFTQIVRGGTLRKTATVVMQYHGYSAKRASSADFGDT
jgi:hypothetical protein